MAFSFSSCEFWRRFRVATCVFGGVLVASLVPLSVDLSGRKLLVWCRSFREFGGIFGSLVAIFGGVFVSRLASLAAFFSRVWLGNLTHTRKSKTKLR